MKKLTITMLSVCAFGLSLAASDTINVYKSPSCGCCTKWADIMRNDGFKVVEHFDDNALDIKSRNNVPLDLSSCHTGVIDGYVVEGHVPSFEIKRLLNLKPTGVVGISVPGMPLHSPGMEQGNMPEMYDVVLFKTDGTREVFATYIGNKKIR